MKILFITNLIPYPVDNGGKIKTYNTIKILAQDNEIDLLSFYEEESELKGKEHLYQFCKTIDCVKKPLTTSKNLSYMKKMGIKNLFHITPLVAYKYKDDQFKSLIKEKLEKNNYDVIYIDHLQLGVYLNDVKGKAKLVVLDEHNAECTIIHRQVQKQSNIVKKSYLYYEYMRLKNFESKIINESDKVIVLSDEDKTTLKAISNAPDDKFIQIPIPVEINYQKKSGIENKKEYNIMFLGTLSWFPNAQGIEWFVENVVPLLDKQGFKYKLYIVGKDPNPSLKELCDENDNIIVTGFVDDVNDYIELCDFMVVPLFIGSGMRVKILEAMGKNMPIISTKIGAEGIEVEDGKSVLMAENENEFVEAINKITDVNLYEKLRSNAKQVFEDKYSVNTLVRLYNKVLNNKK